MSVSGSDLVALLQSPLSALNNEGRRGLSSTYAELQQMVRFILPSLALLLSAGVAFTSPTTCSIPAASTATPPSAWTSTASALSDHIVNYCTQNNLHYQSFIYCLWIECVVLILPSFLYMQTVGKDMYRVVYDLEHCVLRLIDCMQQKRQDDSAVKLANYWRDFVELASPSSLTTLTQPQPHQQQLQQQPSSVKLAIHSSGSDASGDEAEQKRGRPAGESSRLLDQEQDREQSAPDNVAAMMRDTDILGTFAKVSECYAPSWSKRWRIHETAEPAGSAERGEPCCLLPCIPLSCFNKSWYSLFWWTTVAQVLLALVVWLMLVFYHALSPGQLGFQAVSTAVTFDCTGIPITMVDFNGSSLVSSPLLLSTTCVWKYPTISFIFWWMNLLLVSVFLAASVGKFRHMFWRGCTRKSCWSLGFSHPQPLVHDDGSLILYSLLFWHPQVLTPRRGLAYGYQKCLYEKKKQKQEQEERHRQQRTTRSSLPSPYTPFTASISGSNTSASTGSTSTSSSSSSSPRSRQTQPQSSRQLFTSATQSAPAHTELRL